MAKPCSYDLRQKVIQAIELNGLKKIGFTRKSGATLRREPALGNAHQEKFNQSRCSCY